MEKQWKDSKEVREASKCIKEVRTFLLGEGNYRFNSIISALITLLVEGLDKVNIEKERQYLYSTIIKSLLDKMENDDLTYDPKTASEFFTSTICINNVDDDVDDREKKVKKALEALLNIFKTVE